MQRENTKEKMLCEKLFETAIPDMLIRQIKVFMEGRIDQKDMDCLYTALFQKMYWTHLHKCFTDDSGKHSLSFSRKRGYICADKWLKEELSYAISNKTKFLIVLGKEAQNWVSKWKKTEERYQNIKVINLLHSSGQNNRIWRRSAEKEIEQTKRAIREWVNLCKED